MKKVATRKDVNPKSGKQKYGDVKFADAKNKKYPIDTPDHIRAAWNYINKSANANKYSTEDVKTIKATIVSAWKKKIDKAGPPAVQEKSEKAEGLTKSFHVALPLEKVVEGPNGELFVEGFLARVDLPDKTPGMAEQMDEALSTPNFEKWVHETQQRSDGKSLFNAREMHSNKAAGRGVEFKHVEGVGYWGRSEVVDPDTKEKVRKGVITSHSVGGHYGKTWIEKGVLRYEAHPIEVSYVDVPMIPGTEFQFQHANGEIEMRKFENVQPPQSNPPTAKEFIAQYAALKKDGAYAVDPEYARSEAWDIATAARVIEQATQLMSGEAEEPEDAAEVAGILRAVAEFMQGEINEMESAATGEEPEAEGLQCGSCSGELAEGMAFCPHCGAKIEPVAESEEEDAEAEEPEMEADNGGEAEAEDAEANPEEESEPEETPGLDEEKVKEIVREVLAELSQAEKAEMVGELTKAMTPLTSQFEKLEKGQKALAGNVDRITGDLAKDIAQVVNSHNQLETSVGALQKTVESYGPVTRLIPHQNISNNPQALTEKDVIKSVLATTQLSPMLKQAYQSRLTELEIAEAKPLEEPPSFV